MALSRFRSLTQLFRKPQILSVLQTDSALHTTSQNLRSKSEKQANNYAPQHWLKYNDVVYPPQQPGEKPRPAFVCHQKSNIKYSPYKMWYVACMIRGMTVDEAIKQLKFCSKKGAKYVREALEEAKEMAVKDHNVEFASNLWVAESFTGKGQVIKGLRRHARQRAGLIKYIHCHYFVRLEEGKPPKDYYQKAGATEPSEQLQGWLEQMRKRKITNSL